MIESINIGKKIREIIAEKGISQAQLGRMLKKPATYITRLLNKETIDTENLIVICLHLKYNLFADFSKSEMLDEEYQCIIDIKNDNDDIWSPGCILLRPHIGNKIVDILKQKKVTQAELGDYLGVSHQEVSRLLKNNSIDTGKLVLISNFLKYNFFGCYYLRENSEEMMAGGIIDLIVCIVLGVKGSKWAWANKTWKSAEHFNRVQHKWAVAGAIVFVLSLVIGIIAALASIGI